ncbi:YggS family pyridoxal phosphate-dependent enzyme [Arthrobacter sp. PAMC25564]|uniref:YggS family pyridoxal phosphate-dependent enzyme n=1 Tax=Arthrobacter sp. PAMC25564 TaxID=2565366 RepID=UPI0010A29031|nr:YggS family pyridoxal phosphate-dependent enzyme [Arthrobacter sp. PAMC25564]QCB98154.1 YggS family pyridoxal phosphate-dependent enzyme [Arthrobacter sp. PAMC25564]
MTERGPVAGPGTSDGAAGVPPADARTAQLRERLAAVRQRIDGAVADAGRQGNPPQLVVVTKFHPAADVRRLSALGITDVGENRDQEASDKAARLQDLDLRWHFIGQLQSNKAKSVVKYAHAVHSVDRLQLALALAKAMAAERERTGRPPLQCFIQVSLDDDADGHRGGALPADVPELAERLAGTADLRLAGVMAVAPLGVAPAAAFEKLAAISARLTALHPGATGISAGMSQDLEAAIRFGATHLRIGSDILGPRPALR